MYVRMLCYVMYCYVRYVVYVTTFSYVYGMCVCLYGVQCRICYAMRVHVMYVCMYVCTGYMYVCRYCDVCRFRY